MKFTSKNLIRLILTKNLISEISSSLRNFPILQHLDLSYNKVEKLQNLAHVKMLQYLNVKANLLTLLKENIFMWLKDLLYVDFTSNPITFIDGKVFRNQAKLTSLHINHTEISRLDGNMFLGLVFVHTISLCFNSI